MVGTVVSQLVSEVDNYMTFGFEDTEGNLYTVWVKEETVESLGSSLPQGKKVALIVTEIELIFGDEEEEPWDIVPLRIVVAK